MLESLFNSEYCKIFKAIYFEENLRMDASEDVFMKLRKIISFNFTLKSRFFKHRYQKQFYDWYFMIGFP